MCEEVASQCFSYFSPANASDAREIYSRRAMVGRDHTCMTRRTPWLKGSDGVVMNRDVNYLQIVHTGAELVARFECSRDTYGRLVGWMERDERDFLVEEPSIMLHPFDGRRVEG